MPFLAKSVVEKIAVAAHEILKNRDGKLTGFIDYVARCAHIAWCENYYAEFDQFVKEAINIYDNGTVFGVSLNSEVVHEFTQIEHGGKLLGEFSEPDLELRVYQAEVYYICAKKGRFPQPYHNFKLCSTSQEMRHFFGSDFGKLNPV